MKRRSDNGDCDQYSDADAIDLTSDSYSVTDAEFVKSDSQSRPSSASEPAVPDIFQRELFESEINPDSTERQVYKHNIFIHARFDMSGPALKVLDAVISNINPFEEVKSVVLSKSELARLVGVTRQAIDNSIDQISYELSNIDLKVDYTYEDWKDTVDAELRQAERENRKPRKIPRPTTKDSYVSIKLLDRRPYNAEAQMLTFVFHERAKGLIGQLKGNYTYYQLKQIREMSSRYSMRLYAILRSALSLKEVSNGKFRAVKDIPYLALREMLHISDSIYKEFYAFKRSVLEKARLEMEETDLRFRYELPDRPHHKAPVRTIRFFIVADAAIATAALSMDKPISWEFHFEKLFTSKGQEKLNSEYSLNRIQRNIEHYAEYISIPENKTINSPAAWVRKAIREDYAGVEYVKHFNTTDLDQMDYIKNVMQKHWVSFDDETRDDFIDNGFDSITISTLFENFKAKKAAARAKANQNKPSSKQETRRKVSETLMDIGDTNW